MEKKQQSKADKIEEVRSGLPLPEDAPTASDFNSTDTKPHAGVGSGGDGAHNPGISSSTGLGSAGPATGDSAVRTSGQVYNKETAGTEVGRSQGGKLPSDAVAGAKKGSDDVESTEKPDYGYPQKNDPSSGVDGPTRREL